MGIEVMYNILIAIVVIMKLIYVIIAIALSIAKGSGWKSNKIAYLNNLKEESLIASEVFMYLVLIIIFFPSKQAKDIRVGREEQLIIFILGILGILHTNWERFAGFFLHAGNAVFKRN